MSSIITLDALNEETELAQTQTNFPALMHRFPCTETEGAVISDTVGGVGVAVTGISGDGDKLSTTGAVVAGALAAGAWVQPASKNIVLITFVDNQVDLGLQIGEGYGDTLSERAIGSDAISQNFRISDGTATATDLPGALAVGVTGNMMQYLHNTSIQNTFVTASTLALQDNGATANTIDLSAQTIADEGAISANSSSLHGILVFHFDTIPSDADVALMWMTDEWCNNGNKVIYPAWKGKS